MPGSRQTPARTPAQVGGGVVEIAALADELGYSQKHLISRFNAGMGGTRGD